MTAYGEVMYGLGGAALDPANGLALLARKIQALGVVVPAPLTYADVQVVADAIAAAPAGARIIVGGDSLGANNAPYVAAALRGRRTVDYMFGFQPSVWGIHAAVPDNVVEALCIYNPDWIETFGLGDDPWVKAPGNDVTNLRLVTTADLHPGDDDQSMQVVVLADIKRIIGG